MTRLSYRISEHSETFHRNTLPSQSLLAAPDLKHSSEQKFNLRCLPNRYQRYSSDGRTPRKLPQWSHGSGIDFIDRSRAGRLTYEPRLSAVF